MFIARIQAFTSRLQRALGQTREMLPSNRPVRPTDLFLIPEKFMDYYYYYSSLFPAEAAAAAPPPTLLSVIGPRRKWQSKDE